MINKAARLRQTTTDPARPSLVSRFIRMLRRERPRQTSLQDRKQVRPYRKRSRIHRVSPVLPQVWLQVPGRNQARCNNLEVFLERHRLMVLHRRNTVHQDKRPPVVHQDQPRHMVHPDNLPRTVMEALRKACLTAVASKVSRLLHLKPTVRPAGAQERSSPSLGFLVFSSLEAERSRTSR